MDPPRDASLKARWLYSVASLLAEWSHSSHGNSSFPLPLPGTPDPLAEAAERDWEGQWKVGVWVGPHLIERWEFQWEDDDVFGTWESSDSPLQPGNLWAPTLNSLPLRSGGTLSPIICPSHFMENSMEFRISSPTTVHLAPLGTSVGTLRVTGYYDNSPTVPEGQMCVSPIFPQKSPSPLISSLELSLSPPLSPPLPMIPNGTNFSQATSPPYLSFSSPPSYSLFPRSPPSPFPLLSFSPPSSPVKLVNDSHESLPSHINGNPSIPPPHQPKEPNGLNQSNQSDGLDRSNRWNRSNGSNGSNGSDGSVGSDRSTERTSVGGAGGSVPRVSRPGTPTPTSLPRPLARQPHRQLLFLSSLSSSSLSLSPSLSSPSLSSRSPSAPSLSSSLPSTFAPSSPPSLSSLSLSSSSVPLSPPSSLPLSYVSPSELLGPFVGSFQESIMSGHMSSIPCSLLPGFSIDLGVCGTKGAVPPHREIPFTASVYHLTEEVPYVATVPLDSKGYKIPAKGLLQLVLRNPSQTPIKTFLLRYDLSDMPPLSKTFLRQRVTTPPPSPLLQYAVQVKIVSPKKKRFYLYSTIRVVFAHRLPDSEKLLTTYDSPTDPKYFPYTPRSLRVSQEVETEEETET